MHFGMLKQVKPHFVKQFDIMSDPDWDLSVYCRTRRYNVLQPPPLHMGHKDDRGPISLAGPGPPRMLRRLY